MNIQGKIKVIGQTQEVGSNGFKKRDLVVTTNEQYPQDISIDFIQNNCVLLDNFNIGDSVDVSINLRGREWTNPQGEVKYFNSIQGWRISKDSNPSGSAVEAHKQSQEQPKEDLPF